MDPSSATTALIAALVGGIGSNMGGDTWRSFKSSIAAALSRAEKRSVDEETAELEGAHTALVRAHETQDAVAARRVELGMSERFQRALEADPSCSVQLLDIAKRFSLIADPSPGNTVINNNYATGGGQIASGYDVHVTFESGH